ncbi:MAG: ATP-binding cassette domain-containing protein, partial [Nitrosopumilus sp.]|nr:ATP-binding cassette domain-containing protein [Nitrosopumilus sp.]
YPTNDLIVKHVHVERGDAFKLRLASKCGKISLANGQKIYIEGPTGGGKSTFVKAILGLIPGADMNIGKPENYYHYVADYFQEIKEKMPSSKISIRNYFKDETNDKTIDKYLLRVFSKMELNSIKEVLISQKDDLEIVNIEQHVKNAYDMEINEKISGGQKSRLILTLRGYEADMKNKGIIVLDEPCPDVDHDTYTEIMNKFFHNYDHCTIIMIGHLCACKKAALEIEWTQEFCVRDGLISRIR